MQRAHSRWVLFLGPALVLAFFACGGRDLGSNGSGSGAGEQPTSRGTPEERAEATVHKVVEICRQEDWAGAAEHFVYRGDDRSRAWKDTWNPEDESERLRAKAGCDSLLYGAFPETDSDYALGDFSVEEEPEGTWYLQELTFPGAPDAGPAIVAFLEIDGRLAVGDVD